MDDAHRRWVWGVSAVLLGIGGVGTLTVAGFALRSAPAPEPEPEVESIPDRYVQLLLEKPPEPKEEEARGADPEAGEGARSHGAADVGVLGALGDSDLPQGVGGLIGTNGTAIGAGGLGTRGGGLGGGGTAEGLGGLGARGMGSGASGYGSGGGNFGRYAPISQDVRAPPPHPMELAARDFQSTFAIDVDTGAYSQARRSLREGALPVPAAVRTEEFVNALTYDYPEPDGAVPFSVSVEGAPNPFVRGHQIVRVGLHGRRPAEDRRPVHLTFLVDTSCSMTDADRLPLAKEAMGDALDHLGPRDTVAIATYAGSTEVVLGATPAAHDAVIRRAIASLSNGGGTAMADGMKLAYDLAWKAYVAGDENRVVVLSDGDANIGAASPEQILKELAGNARKGVTLSTVGFGSGNYRDALMEQLADKGDGNYSYVDSADEARRIFGEDLLSTVQTIARDVKVQVDFDPGAVLAYRLIGYENRDVADQDFRNDQVDGGEIGAGHTVTALYDVVLKDQPAGDLATVHLRYKPPGAEAASKEIAVALPVFAIQPSFAGASSDLRLAFGMAEFAEKLRGAEDASEVGWDAILRIVQGAPHAGDRDEELAELIGLAAKLSPGPVARY
jgi:Ca-activated chloride channel family protein